jgi:uncharacterized membrane protein
MINPQTFFTLYIVALPVFLIIDFLWLGFIASGFYKSQIGFLMGEVRWVAALIFYAIFALGLTFFAIYPAVTKGTYATALVLGALFGFFTYATYDLTNLATLRGWPVTLVVVDILWGICLSATVALATMVIATRIL